MSALALPAYANWNWITPRLAIGGEPPPEAYSLLHAYGFEAVLDMRDAQEAAHVTPSPHVARLHLPTPDRMPPHPADFDRALSFVRRGFASEHRVLVHCVHGIGRSAIVGLSVLVADGMTPLEALELAKNRRWKISPSPEQYEAWAAWLMRYRQLTMKTFDVPDFDRFASIAYRHLVLP